MKPLRCRRARDTPIIPTSILEFRAMVQGTLSMTLAKDVDKLEREYNNLKELCGEIIITFMLKENTEIFEDLPPKWHRLVDRWQRWYKDITSEDIQKYLKIVQQTSPHLADWAIVSDATVKVVAQELERRKKNDNN